MKRKTVVIGVGGVITAMMFAGVALSLDRSSARIGPTPEEVAEAARKIPGTEKAHPSPRVEGETWSLRSYRNVRQEVCLSHDVPGEAVGTGCLASDKVFSRGPLYVLRGARQEPAPYAKTAWDRQWVYGLAHPAVKTLTLVSMDCSTQDLVLDEDGAFNYVVGTDTIQNGQLPYKLIARNSAGQTIAEESVAIGLSRNAREAGHKAPSPKAACR